MFFATHNCFFVKINPYELCVIFLVYEHMNVVVPFLQHTHTIIIILFLFFLGEKLCVDHLSVLARLVLRQ